MHSMEEGLQHASLHRAQALHLQICIPLKHIAQIHKTAFNSTPLRFLHGNIAIYLISWGESYVNFDGIYLM